MLRDIPTQAPKATLNRTLTLVPVVMMGLASLQPMTIFDTFGIVSGITGGHVATAYVFALVAVLFTALSYGKLVRRFPTAGSAYTYTQQSINPHLGFMVGWSSLLDYMFMPMINILLAKSYLEAILPGIPGWVFVAILVFIMTFFNLRGVRLVANLNTFIVVVQVAIMAVFIGLVIYGVYMGEGQGTLLSARPFWSEDAKLVATITGATILCFSFLGFDGLSALCEETKDARNVIPKAIFLTAFIGGVIFIVVSYFLQLYFPDVTRFTNPDSSQPEIMLFVAGKLFQSVILVFSCATVLASGMAAHTSASRLMYVMGRDGVLPKRLFAYINPKYRTPSFNIIFVGVLALAAVWFDLVKATALVNFGALVAFSFVNISVIAQFYIRERMNQGWKNTLQYLILPAFGIFTVGALWVNLEETAMTLGLSWAALGVIYLLFLTRGLSRPVPQDTRQLVQMELDD